MTPDEWVSVKDRLPEHIHTMAYLVTDGCEITIAYYRLALWDDQSGENWDWWFNGRITPPKVKWWMPLPKLPKKSREKKLPRNSEAC